MTFKINSSPAQRAKDLAKMMGVGHKPTPVTKVAMPEKGKVGRPANSPYRPTKTPKKGCF